MFLGIFFSFSIKYETPKASSNRLATYCIHLISKFSRGTPSSTLLFQVLQWEFHIENAISNLSKQSLVYALIPFSHLFKGNTLLTTIDTACGAPTGAQRGRSLPEKKWNCYCTFFNCFIYIFRHILNVLGILFCKL